MTTNAEAQATFSAALEKLASLPLPEDELERAWALSLQACLATGKAYSASGNSIPGLGGRGLAELLTLAKTVVSPSFTWARRPPELKLWALSLLGGEPS